MISARSAKDRTLPAVTRRLAQASDDRSAIICRVTWRKASPLDTFRFAKCLVGRGGVEPPTSRLSGVRSNHLSYRPLPAERLKAISMTAACRAEGARTTSAERTLPADPGTGSPDADAGPHRRRSARRSVVGGAYRDRTDDLLNAIQPLSQLS